MLEGSLGVTVSSPSCLVQVVGGVDDLRVDSVNEPNLLLGEPRPVDGEGWYADVPEGDGVKRTLHEYHGTAIHRGVVEEETRYVDSSGVEILRAVPPSKRATYNAQNSLCHSA